MEAPMRSFVTGLAFIIVTSDAAAQAPGKWPPDSLINTKVIPHNTPVIQVVGQMRNFASWLGVRCTYCHVGQEEQPLEAIDFASDTKRTKLVARQMMMMVGEINRRLDTLPGGRGTPAVNATCNTCHRGLSRPVPLSTVVADAAVAVNADSAERAYRALRRRYFGREAYDFGEFTLNSAAFRVATQARKYDDAMQLLALNETLFPYSAQPYVFRGNVLLLKGDSAAAAVAFREALARDTSNVDAKQRLAVVPVAQQGQPSAAPHTPAQLTRDAYAAADSAVRAVVTRYLHGLKFNDTLAFKDAFWPNARLMFIKNDGTLGELTQPQWYKMFAGSVGKEEPGELAIASVDVSGTAASVKVTEIYPGNPGSTYLDYLNLLRIGNEWRIVNKIYVAYRRAP